MTNGVVLVKSVEGESVCQVLRYEEFVSDYNSLRSHLLSGYVASYSRYRLSILEHVYKIHILQNAGQEDQATKAFSQIDYDSVIKVDTHIHH